MEIIYGFAYLKKAAAHANCDAGVLDQNKRDLIARFVMKYSKENWTINFPW
jgi:fumarate hydratase class II